jgi:hypothetical protein
MRKVFSIVLFLASAGCLIAAGYEKADYAKGSADRIKAAFDVEHTRASLQNDQLEIENAQIQMRIDERTGKRNNGSALSLARAKRGSDEMLLSVQEATASLEPAEDINGELLKLGMGLFFLLLGVVVLLAGRRPQLQTA